MELVTTLVLAAAALCAVFVAFVVVRAAPRLTVVLWSLVLFFVPIWVGVNLGPFWSLVTLTTILAIASCSRMLAVSPADGLIAGFVLLIVGQFALGLTSLSGLVIALSEWVLPFVWGRLVLTRVTARFLIQVLAVIAVIAAALAVIESLTSVNVFAGIPGSAPSLFDTWSPLQARGSLIRAEGAFGHSIALGAVLAMCAAFILAAPWRLALRLLALAVVAVAVAQTLSRIGLITLVITIALSTLVLPQLTARARACIAAAGILGALVIVPFISDVFLDAGQEASGSADYRVDLWNIAGVIPLFGSAPDIGGLTVDGQYLGVFAKSVDNAVLVSAMRVGWAPTALLLSVLVFAILPLVRGGANAASVAVAAQLPGMFTVAWITQYAVFFWFSVGLAVAMGAARREEQATDSLAVIGGSAAPLIGWEAGSARIAAGPSGGGR